MKLKLLPLLALSGCTLSVLPAQNSTPQFSQQEIAGAFQQRDQVINALSQKVDALEKEKEAAKEKTKK